MSDYSPLRMLSGDDVDELATVPVGLAAARDAAMLADGAGVTAGRVQINGTTAWMRILAGLVDDLDVIGYKEFHRVGDRVRYHVHLYRQSTGDALGVVDGRRITSLRTSSTAAVAAAHWAQGRPVRVGLIGSGEEAREGLRALAGALVVRRACVFSPTPANREAFASTMSDELGLEVVARPDQATVIAESDVLYVATSSHHQPFLKAADLEGLGMVAAIGSTQPVHRELYGDVFGAAAAVVVDTRDAIHEAGDCIEATEQGWDPGAAVLLADYLRSDPEQAPGGLMLFKSIGSVEQDIVLAHHLLVEAERLGRGVVTEDVASLRIMR